MGFHSCCAVDERLAVENDSAFVPEDFSCAGDCDGLDVAIVSQGDGSEGFGALGPFCNNGFEKLKGYSKTI